MKKHSFIPLIIALAFAMSFSSCEQLSLPTEDTHESLSKQTVTVKTRSTTNDILYPIIVYAFAENGTCSAQQTINSSDDALALSLLQGTYRIIALSKASGYILPSNPTLTSAITISNDNNCTSVPLQMGQADINVGKSSQTVNITLSYKVTPIDITLRDVPSTVTDVSVTISSQHSSLSMTGEYADSKKSVVNLTKQGDSWSAKAYVFPGSSTQTVMSISLTNADGSTSFGYTYNAPLQAATPYNFNGTFVSDNIQLYGSFLSEGWNTPISIDFTFGSGNENTDDDIPTQIVSKFPTAGSVWDNHIVAYAYDDSGNILSPEQMEPLSRVNLLLISLQEWQKVKSSLSETNPEEASDIANSYVEDGLTGWSIPSLSEMANMTSIHNITFEETIEALNETIASIGGDIIYARDDDDKNIRFLCDDGKSSFVWRRNNDVRPAGANTKYSLRLVNHVRVEK